MKTCIPTSVRQLFALGIFVFVFSSCEETDKVEAEIQNITVNLDIDRFEQQFYRATTAELPQLKQKYPYFFPEQFADSVWAHRIQDSLQQALFQEVNSSFKDFQQQEDALTDLFKHYSYYFPKKELPKVVTLMSDVDYENKVINADSLLLISLDTYLGENHPMYEGISQYQRARMDKALLPADVSDAMVFPKISQPRSRTLLAKMIYYGKLHYAKDLMLPTVDDHFKIGFSAEELTWAENNEANIWKYFVENELLYDTDSKLNQRFIEIAPFSKFYLEFDQESPGRIGQWVGWQIVRSFSANKDVSLPTLLALDAETIFNQSKYKPKK